jgi:hypothetical protein
MSSSSEETAHAILIREIDTLEAQLDAAGLRDSPERALLVDQVHTLASQAKASSSDASTFYSIRERRILYQVARDTWVSTSDMHTELAERAFRLHERLHETAPASMQELAAMRDKLREEIANREARVRLLQLLDTPSHGTSFRASTLPFNAPRQSLAPLRPLSARSRITTTTISTTQTSVQQLIADNRDLFE